MHRNHHHVSIFRMKTHPTGSAVNIEGTPVEHFRKAGAHVHLRSLFRKAIIERWEQVIVRRSNPSWRTLGVGGSPLLVALGGEVALFCELVRSLRREEIIIA